MNRRQFLKSTGLLSIGASSFCRFFRHTELVHAFRGKVVEITKKYPSDDELNQMFKLGLFTLTKTNDHKEAWSRFLTQKDIVGIKINTNHTRCYASRGLIEAVINSLLNYGLHPGQIVVWDRFQTEYGLKSIGYDLQNDPTGIRWISTDMEGIGYDLKHYYFHPAIDEGKKGWYAKTEEFRDPKLSYFSRIVTEIATKIINLSTMKHHSITGITLSLKNLSFGATNNTPRFHRGGYVQAIPQVFNSVWLRDKSILHIIEGINGVFHKGPVDNGPDYVWPGGKLIMSIDPVAADSHGLKLINEERKKRNLSLIGDSEQGLDYINKASQIGLGEINPEVIQLSI